MATQHTPDTSWIAGKYSWKIDDGRNTIEAEINTRLPYVAIGGFYAQGDDADSVIQEIHFYWIKNNCTTLDAVKWWFNTFV